MARRVAKANDCGGNVDGSCEAGHDSPPESTDGSEPDEKGTPLIVPSGDPITIGFLLKVFKNVDPSLEVHLCVHGTEYDSSPLVDAVLFAPYGAIFLIGEDPDGPGDDDEEEDAIEGDWVEVPRGPVEEEVEDYDGEAAEPA